MEQFRSSSARPLATVWWALSAVALVDLALRGRDHLALEIAFAILLTDAAIWLGAWRPGIELHPAHVILRGSLRDRSLTLAAITAASAVGPLMLWAGDRRFVSAAAGSTLRQRRRAARETAAVPPSFAGALRGGFGRGGRTGPPGLDDPRMDPATRDAVVGRTPGLHAAESIVREARRLRRVAGTSDAEAGAELVTGVRWVLLPAAGTLALLLAFLAVALS